MKIAAQTCMPRIATFISPHGFGHASRASAVMEAVQRLCPQAHFEIFTHVPRWFFEESLSGSFSYHDEVVDVGMVQRSALSEDIPATLQELNKFLPLKSDWVSALSNQVRASQCELVISDITPLGIAVAHAAGVPALLIENFTWDWIYRGYRSHEHPFEEFALILEGLYREADYHIHTVPGVAPSRADLVSRPVSRSPRTPPAEVRQLLGIPPEAAAVLVSMGGIPTPMPGLEQARLGKSLYLVLTGGMGPQDGHEQFITLPRQSEFYHPDLVSACDAVIGKAGYSTIAEAYNAGKPLAYLSRDQFREAPILAEFVEQTMGGFEIPLQEFHTGTWIERLPDLLALRPKAAPAENGADQISKWIGSHILELLD
jgi:hypothetical protein